jgi:hypothetical protein
MDSWTLSANRSRRSRSVRRAQVVRKKFSGLTNSIPMPVWSAAFLASPGVPLMVSITCNGLILSEIATPQRRPPFLRTSLCWSARRRIACQCNPRFVLLEGWLRKPLGSKLASMCSCDRAPAGVRREGF